MTKEEFKKFVKRSKMKMDDIADAIGYSRSSMDAYLYGYRKITKKMVIALNNLKK